MAIQTAVTRTELATAYGVACPFTAVYTTVPAGTAGTEPAGGSPAYARVASGWGAAAASVITCAPTLDIPAGTTVAGVGFHTLATGGVYKDGVGVTSQPFASQGTYSPTCTYTQT